jgi:predicted HAD superfamily Cof-like phosphohydrolase
MQSNFEKVAEFHKVFGHPVEVSPHFPEDGMIELRKELIHEEFQELLEALSKRDLVEVADALTDILYVVYGAGHTFGIDLDECFREVHRSNMSKLGEDGKAILREDGKVMKGPNYSDPDLKEALGWQHFVQ